MNDNTNTDQETTQKPLEENHTENHVDHEEDILMAAEIMRMISEADCPANYCTDNRYVNTIYSMSSVHNDTSKK